jgi:acyl carrier protein
VLDEVRRLVADLLALDPAQVRPESTWFKDLDAESIEILELSFHCEKRFGVRARFESLLSLDLVEGPDGLITAESLAALQARHPMLDLARIAENPKRSRLREAITVGAIAQFVQMAIEAGEPRDGKA